MNGKDISDGLASFSYWWLKQERLSVQSRHGPLVSPTGNQIRALGRVLAAFSQYMPYLLSAASIIDGCKHAVDVAKLLSLAKNDNER